MTRPLLLGHRGARASRHIPENTLASFELCLQHGCDGFEFDVRRSADGQAVVCHDATSRGMTIAESAAKDLGLPTLEEVLRQFSSRAFLDIELKVAGLEEQTLAALRTFPPKIGYVGSSFLPEVLRALHALDASVPLGLLCEKRDQLAMERRASLRLRSGQASPVPGPVTSVIPRVDLVDRELVEALHAAGEKVMVWTVNRAKEMRRLAEWGVDSIISDDTELLVRTMRPMADLIIVVDPNYADQLPTVAQHAPAWVVSTKTNRDACERLWRSHPHSDHREKGAITCYQTPNAEDRAGSLIGIIPQLETHHGEVEDDEIVFPKGFVLEVIGLALTDKVMHALQEFGFTSFVATTEGFQARK